MAKGEDSRAEMAQARQIDGINVVFDQNSPASSRSRSRSSCGSSRSSGSVHHRGRNGHKGRHRSSSSSSSSSRHSRSRSHPRCHRRSSRCGCKNHHRYGRHRRSPPRRYRAHSRSYSRSPAPDTYSRRRRYRSRSRSTSRWSRHRSAVNQVRSKAPRSPARSHRSRSRSRSSGHSHNLSTDDKRGLLEVAKANAMNILGAKELELPESVRPILPEELVESRQASPEPEPESRVRQDPEKTQSQSSDVEPDDISSPKMSPKRRIISFSINNSVAKPTVAAPSSAKVTARVDSYESRKPYGHWVPVKSGRKHTLRVSH